MANAARGSTTGPFTVLFAPAHTCLDESLGGSEYYWAFKIIERLALDHGVHCIVLTIQPNIQSIIPGVQFISVNPGGRLPASGMESLTFHLRCYAAARRILASGQHHVDLIHHMLPFGFRATFNILALQRRHTHPPIVIGPLQAPLSFSNANEELYLTARDFSAPPPPPPSIARQGVLLTSSLLTAQTLSVLSARTLRRSAARIAVSERAARLYRAYTGLEAFSIIPPGVDVDRFTPSATRKKEMSRLGDAATIRIVAVGSLIQRKALDVLISALGKLVNLQIRAHLCLVGDGPARSRLEDLVYDLNLKQHVTFAGHIPHNQMAHIYQQSDIFCSTSRSEGFSTVCLEALSCGLPVVATPAGGFREILSRHDVGRLVPFGKVDELAHALAELARQPELRATLGLRARTVAVQEYDWRIIGQQYLSVYKSIVEPAHGID